MMEERSANISLAIIDRDSGSAALIRAAFESAPNVTKVVIIGEATQVESAIEQGQVNAIAIDIFTVGLDNGLDIIAKIRETHPDLPFCLLGSSHQLVALPGVPEPWKQRFSHYYRLYKDQPATMLAQGVLAMSERFGLYILSRKAKDSLHEIKNLLARNTIHSPDLDAEKSKQIQNAIRTVEAVIDAKITERDIQTVVPGFGEEQLQDLIQSTLAHAHTSLNRFDILNMGVLVVGLLIVAGSFVAGLYGRSSAVAFGGFGMAGIIASLIRNPLGSVGGVAYRLVRLQVAYLGFLNQVRLLNLTAGTRTDSQILERSTQLNKITLEIIKALNLTSKD